MIDLTENITSKIVSDNQALLGKLKRQRAEYMSYSFIHLNHCIIENRKGRKFSCVRTLIKLIPSSDSTQYDHSQRIDST